MQKVFIADAHLRKPEDFNYRTLLKFLEELKGNTETLFILGDLFEFWIGFRNMPFTHYVPVLNMLVKLRESGTHLVYFEGNHDFHMGPFFRNTLQADIYRGPAILTINGRKTYLCHGDQIISSDYGHRFLRFILHNPASRILLPLAPYGLASFIAEHLSRRSSGNHRERKRKWDYGAILADFAAERFAEGCDTVITGHFHTPYLVRTESESGEKILLSLGDWKSQFSYGELVGDSLELRTFPA